jgi:hypothetical protein
MADTKRTLPKERAESSGFTAKIRDPVGMPISAVVPSTHVKYLPSRMIMKEILGRSLGLG